MGVSRPRPSMHNSLSAFMFRLLPSGCALIVCACLASCSRPEGIRTYTVEKIPAGRSASASTQAPGSAWFFKLQGPPDAVTAQAEAFEQLVESVSFSSRDEPEWKLPEGWSSAPGNDFRFATLKIGGSEPPLEVAVSTLTAADPASDEYLRMNVERWRGQVKLPPYAAADWRADARESGGLREISTTAGPAFLVKLAGNDLQSGEPAVILAAMIPRAGTVLREPATPAPPGAETDLPLSYTAPSVWQATPAGPMQMLRFTAADGKVEISVSAAGGNLEMNIARWRGQVKLPEASTAELTAALQPIEVDGVAGHYAEIVGETETILGAIVPRGGTNLFFKLRGDRELAARETERFHEFLKTVHFKP